MKVKVMRLFTLTLLCCLLLTAIACGGSPVSTPENTTPSDTDIGTDSTLLQPDSLPPDEEDDSDIDSDTAPDLPAPPEDPEMDTDFPAYPGDIEIELPELQENEKIILSVKDGKVLGASSIDKPFDSDIIDNYSDFQKLYGTVEGIDESFFESNVLRLVHTAQSSGSTRYAVESVTLEDGRLRVEIIEQHAAISTRDLRYWYVFIAVEKSLTETPVDVNVTGIQLAG